MMHAKTEAPGWARRICGRNEREREGRAGRVEGGAGIRGMGGWGRVDGRWGGEGPPWTTTGDTRADVVNPHIVCDREE